MLTQAYTAGDRTETTNLVIFLFIQGLDDEREYGLVKVDLFDEAFEAGLILKQISCGDKHTLAVFEDS